VSATGFAQREETPPRSRTGVSAALRTTLRLLLLAASLCSALLSQSCAAPASASDAAAHASTASTSRWWKLDCKPVRGKRAGEAAPCIFRLKLRGTIDASRLQLLRQAIQRRDAVERTLHREIEVHVDVDSPGGEIFAARSLSPPHTRSRRPS
jgi:membrane-bound ClpP family serine protease